MGTKLLCNSIFNIVYASFRIYVVSNGLVSSVQIQFIFMNNISLKLNVGKF
jgi:hypothetical protein